MGFNIYCTLEIKTNDEKLNEILNLLKSENNIIDFNNISPTPYIFKEKRKHKKENTIESLNIQNRINKIALKTTGFDDLYDWNKHNVGCFGNSNNVKKISKGIYSFNTYNGIPLPIILKLSLIFKNVNFRLFFVGEDFGRDVGFYLIKNGVVGFYYQPESMSEESFGLSYYIQQGDIHRSDKDILKKGKEILYDMEYS